MVKLNNYEKNCLKEIVDLVKDLENLIKKKWEQGFELTHTQKESLECTEKLSKGRRG